MIHFDQASSAFPKAPTVGPAIAEFLQFSASNVGRGSLNASQSAAQTVLNCRRRLATMFDAPGPRQVVFTANVTASLNLLIKGFFKAGDHVVLSSLEHNAVMRPIGQMLERGLSFSCAEAGPGGLTSVEAFARALQPNTKAILCTAASNVCGTRLPLAEIGALCREKGLYFFVDAAQLAGLVPISMRDWGIHALAITGHKALLGPQGIGALLLAEGLGEQLDPLLAGGTGSLSDQEVMPQQMPDHLEAGTLNLPGIAGWLAALDYLQEVGMATIHRHELDLCRQFLEGLEQLPVRLIGLDRAASTADNRVAVVSIQTLNDLDESELAFRLEQELDVATRVGLHCAPRAHKALGTFPRGSLRFSFGYWNTSEEIAIVLKKMAEILA